MCVGVCVFVLAGDGVCVSLRASVSLFTYRAEQRCALIKAAFISYTV